MKSAPFLAVGLALVLAASALELLEDDDGIAHERRVAQMKAAHQPKVASQVAEINALQRAVARAQQRKLFKVARDKIGLLEMTKLHAAANGANDVFDEATPMKGELLAPSALGESLGCAAYTTYQSCVNAAGCETSGRSCVPAPTPTAAPTLAPTAAPTRNFTYWSTVATATDSGSNARCAQVACMSNEISQSECDRVASATGAGTTSLGVTAATTITRSELDPGCYAEFDLSSGLSINDIKFNNDANGDWDPSVDQSSRTWTNPTMEDDSGTELSKVCYGGVTPGRLDCKGNTPGHLLDAAPQNDWSEIDWELASVDQCPDGKLTNKGFYMAYDHDNTAKGGCANWAIHGFGIRNHIACQDISTTTGSEKWVCTKARAGHLHGTAVGMGFFVAKRTYCETTSYDSTTGARQSTCAAYKFGACIKDVIDDDGAAVEFRHTDNDNSVYDTGFNLDRTTSDWITYAAKNVLPNYDGELDSDHQCDSSSADTKAINRYIGMF